MIATAHKGPTVATLTRAQAAEIYALRADLEVRLCIAFYKRASASDMEALRALMKEIEAAELEGDKTARVEIIDASMATSWRSPLWK